MREEVIEGHVEEALDLSGVQIHRDDARDAGRGQEIRDELGRDRRARRDLAVLTAVAVVGDHRGDGARGRA
jgi:hypothetical protein